MSSENEKNYVSRDCNGSELQTGDLVWPMWDSIWTLLYGCGPFLVHALQGSYVEINDPDGSMVSPQRTGRTHGLFRVVQFRKDVFQTAARKVLRDAKGL